MYEPLEPERILTFIDPARLSSLPPFHIFPTLPSTNTYLLNLARQPQPSGLVCIAEEQTGGRGRQGKQWYSPRGNIYCSLLWNFPAAQTDISHLSLAVGVMTARALNSLGINEGLQLKWPNDIYYDNRKLAGILIEATPSRSGTYPVIVGVGLNICSDSAAPLAIIGLEEITRQAVSRNQVLGLLLNELLAGLPLYISKNFSSFLNDYAKYDMLRGKYIVIRTGQLEIAGIGEGINAAGELSIRDQNGKSHLFRCGEVSVVLNADS